MEDLRQQQIEVLGEAVSYAEKMIGALEKVSEELLGEKLPETDSAVDVIVEGLNWLLEVYNGTRSLINPDKSQIDEEIASSAVEKLSKGLKVRDDKAISEAFSEMKTFLEQFILAAKNN